MFPIVIKLSGRMIDCKDSQDEKASSVICFMVFGNVIDFRDEQLMNCPLGISVIPSGIEIDCNDVQ